MGFYEEEQDQSIREATKLTVHTHTRARVVVRVWFALPISKRERFTEAYFTLHTKTCAPVRASSTQLSV